MVPILFVIAACEAPPPYVLNASEFNRDSSAFRNGVTNTDSLTICYAKNGTTAQNVTQLALNECALYGKKAVFKNQSYQQCPLLTPVAAIFDCVETAPTFGFYKTAN